MPSFGLGSRKSIPAYASDTWCSCQPDRSLVGLLITRRGWAVDHRVGPGSHCQALLSKPDEDYAWLNRRKWGLLEG